MLFLTDVTRVKKYFKLYVDLRFKRFDTLKMKFPISDILEFVFLKICRYSEVSMMNLS